MIHCDTVYTDGMRAKTKNSPLPVPTVQPISSESQDIIFVPPVHVSGSPSVGTLSPEPTN